MPEIQPRPSITQPRRWAPLNESFVCIRMALITTAPMTTGVEPKSHDVTIKWAT